MRLLLAAALVCAASAGAAASKAFCAAAIARDVEAMKKSIRDRVWQGMVWYTVWFGSGLPCPTELRNRRGANRSRMHLEVSLKLEILVD